MVDAKDIPDVQREFNELWKMIKKYWNCDYADIDNMIDETRKFYHSCRYEVTRKAVVGLINDIESTNGDAWKEMDMRNGNVQ